MKPSLCDSGLEHLTSLLVSELACTELECGGPAEDIHGSVYRAELSIFVRLVKN